MDVSERSRTALVKFSVVMLLRNFVHAFIIIYRCSLVQPVFVVSVLYARLEVQRLDLDGVLSNPDLTSASRCDVPLCERERETCDGLMC